MSIKEIQSYAIQAVRKLAHKLGRVPLVSEFNIELPRFNMNVFGSYDSLLKAAGLHTEEEIVPKKPQPRPPRILVFDIETKPLKVWAWGTFDQNIGLDMIIEDQSILSFAAKFIGNDHIFYQDLSQNTDYTKDEALVTAMFELLNQADIIIGQNSDQFDIKKLNAKFEEYALGQPTPYKSIDTLKIMRKHLGLTSKKLSFATDKYNKKYKKLKHEKFPGMSLWLECLKGNQSAWECLKEYNIWDCLATEELYLDHLRKWDKSINYGVFTSVSNCCPNCGSESLKELEFNYSKIGIFQNYQCIECHTISSSKHNELSQAQKKNLLK